MEEVRLTEDEFAGAIQAGLDNLAITNEQIARYARPDERHEVALRINAATASVFFIYAPGLDPYGDHPDLPEELFDLGREYFACDPSDGVAVWFHDLPDATRDALEAKRRVAESQGWKRILGGQ